MSMTRRDILVGAGGIIAASAVDAVASDSPIMAKMQSTHADGPRGEGRKKLRPHPIAEPVRSTVSIMVTI